MRSSRPADLVRAMKVVINRCYGGFSISRLAVETMRDLGDAESKAEVLKGETYPYGRKEDYDYGGYGRGIRRDNQILVSVVEKLGDHANGSCANLKVVEIPDGVQWEIDDHYGMEKVVESGRREWR